MSITATWNEGVFKPKRHILALQKKNVVIGLRVHKLWQLPSERLFDDYVQIVHNLLPANKQ